MIVKCSGCGGLMSWDAKAVKFKCTSCEKESEMLLECRETEKAVKCPSCGSELQGSDLLAYKCSSCETPILEDIYLKEDMRPKCIVPFSVDSYEAVEAFRERYKNDGLLARGFLSKATPEHLMGVYKPYYFVSGMDDASYDGQCKKIKKWRDGNKEYTKTDYYRVVRKVKIAYRNVPVYSGREPLEISCESLEPFETQEVKEVRDKDSAKLAQFNPRFIVGFIAERCVNTYEDIRQYALNKIFNISKDNITESIVGYNVIDPSGYHSDFKETRKLIGLAPMWKYEYRMGKKNYTFYINGQTGRVAGNAPISKLQLVRLYLGLSSVAYMIFLILHILNEIIK